MALVKRALRRSSSPLRKKRKTRKGQVPEAVLDALCSKWIRLRDPVCKMGGMADTECSTDGTDWAHYIIRTYRQTRWDGENTHGLCGRHHALVHANPLLAARCWKAVIGEETCNWLWAKAQAVAKIDRHAVKEYLQTRLKEVQG